MHCTAGEAGGGEHRGATGRAHTGVSGRASQQLPQGVPCSRAPGQPVRQCSAPHCCTGIVLSCTVLCGSDLSRQAAVMLRAQVAAVAELPPLALLPNWLVQNRVRHRCCTWRSCMSKELPLLMVVLSPCHKKIRGASMCLLSACAGVQTIPAPCQRHHAGARHLMLTAQHHRLAALRSCS